MAEIEALCQKYLVRWQSRFGFVLYDDFRPCL